MDDIAETILLYLDVESLSQADQVCREWYRIITEGKLWKKLFKGKSLKDSRWRAIAKRYNWQDNFLEQVDDEARRDHKLYKRLYLAIVRDVELLEHNWRRGRYSLHRNACRSERPGVYCMQFDEDKIVSGHRDTTIKIWDRTTLGCVKVLKGHTGSVLCLQFDKNILISGSSDATVKVWDVQTGALMNTLHDHSQAVLNLHYCDDTLVTSSKGQSVVVWKMQSPTDINVRQRLVGHNGSVNVVEFDEKYIVTASSDSTIKVWKKTTCDFVRTLSGHTRGINCMQYRGDLVVSGGTDETIRLWNIETGVCLRVLMGHHSVVRCVRFDSRRIVSGDYDGQINIWDLQAALNPTTPSRNVCVITLKERTERINRLQLDDLQIVSGSADDTIFIRDFLSERYPQAEAVPTPPDRPL